MIQTSVKENLSQTQELENLISSTLSSNSSSEKDSNNNLEKIMSQLTNNNFLNQIKEQQRIKDLFDTIKTHPRSFHSFEYMDIRFVIITIDNYNVFKEAKNPYMTRFHCGGYLLNEEEIQTTFNNLIDRKEKPENIKKTISENAKSEEEIDNEKHSEENSSNYFVCFKDDLPIGLCNIYPTDSLCEISCSYDVLPEFQGKGFGTKILQGIITHITSLNLKYLKKITLLIDTRNIASIKVAKKSGFSIVEELYARNMFCYILEKEIIEKEI